MDDLISRAEAIRIASGYCHPANIADELRKLPSAQSEIIRCKDCKHWREGTSFSYCDKLYGMGVLDALDYMVAEDDYCSMAERREE